MLKTKVSFVAMFALLIGVAAPNARTQSAVAAQQVPRGHFRLIGVDVYPINRTKVNGKTLDDKSDTLTHSLRFDTKAVTEFVEGTQNERYMLLNATTDMSMTVDKPIKYKNKVIPANTNLLDYKEVNRGKSSIRMRPLNAMAYGSIRLTNDFVFAPDNYNIKFEWMTAEGESISKEVAVIIDIAPDVPKPVKKKQTKPGKPTQPIKPTEN